MVLFSMRRRSLSHAAGSFDCSAAKPGPDPDSRARWRLGVGIFGVETLEWFAAYSLSSGPTLTLPRADLEIVERRSARDDEQASVLQGAHVIVCRYGVYGGEPHTISLALDSDALAALCSWLESAPPGANHMIGRFT